MKNYTVYKIISIISYCLIIIQGSIIRLPLIIVLLSSLLESNLADVITSIFALIGLAAIFIISIYAKSKIFFCTELFILLLLLSPLVFKLIKFKFDFFDNIYFMIPFINFIVFYGSYIYNYYTKEIKVST
jgi:hypothetical protein